MLNAHQQKPFQLQPSLSESVRDDGTSAYGQNNRRLLHKRTSLRHLHHFELMVWNSCSAFSPLISIGQSMNKSISNIVYNKDTCKLFTGCYDIIQLHTFAPLFVPPKISAAAPGISRFLYYVLPRQLFNATARQTSPSVRCLRAASETRITFSVVAAATYCVEYRTTQQQRKGNGE